MANKSVSKKIGIGPVRLSYVNFAEPSKMSGKYSARLLLPKSDKASYKILMDGLKEVYENNAGILGDYDFETINPVRDGNGTAAKGKKYSDEHKGMWVINASNKFQPVLRCKDENGVMNDSEDPGKDFYSGCWAKVGLCLFPYSNQSTGIGISLDVVRKTKDDEHLGAVIREDDYFGDDEDDEEV